MEIRIDPLEGQDAPEDTFVAFRVGDVQKQSRFGSSRTYKFPDPGDDRVNFGRIEIFKRVGSRTVNFDTFTGEHQDVQVDCGSQGIDRLGLRLFVKGQGEAAMGSAAQAEKRRGVKKRMDAATQYLSDHGLEEVLADAMREVIHAKPEDPHTFLSSLILKRGGKLKGTTLPPISGASPKESGPARSVGFGMPPPRQRPKTPTQRLPPIEEASAIPSDEPKLREEPVVDSMLGLSVYYRQHFVGLPPEDFSALHARFGAAPAPPAAVVMAPPAPEGVPPAAVAELAEPEALRQMARETLIAAGQDGSLAAALGSTAKEQEDKDAVRLQAREALLAAGRDGTLAATLQSVKAERSQVDDIADVRLQVRSALLTAGSDGTLAATLQSVKAEGQARQQEPRPWYELIPTGPGYEQFQELAKVLMARDKELQELRELFEKRKASKEAKVAAAASAAKTPVVEVVSDQRLNELMPSVGTWLVAKPRGYPRAGPAGPALVLPGAAPVAPLAPVLADPARPFRLQPSVGTWLSPRDEEEPAAPVPTAPVAEPAAVVPSSPIAVPPDDELLTLAGEATTVKIRNAELLDAFQAEILRKEQEIEELKTLLRGA